jgi:DnaJ-class molecular chaperone
VLQRGHGRLGTGGGQTGDLRIRVRVRPHEVFGRSGSDLTVTVPVTFPELVLGAQVKVPVLGRAPVTINIPPGTSSGKTFRLPGVGFPNRIRGQFAGGRFVPSSPGTSRHGHLLVTVNATIPGIAIGENAALAERLGNAIGTADTLREDLISRARQGPVPELGINGEDGDAFIAVPVSFTELLFGAEIKIPKLGQKPIVGRESAADGSGRLPRPAVDKTPALLKIPPGTANGHFVRLPGQGCHPSSASAPRLRKSRGTLVVTLKLVIPDPVSDTIRTAAEELQDVIGTGEQMRAELIARAGKPDQK